MDLGISHWVNPTNVDVRLRLFVSPGQHAEYVIPAGESGEVPAQFDAAVQTVHDGLVVGGLAPQLQKRGATPPPTVHPAIATPVRRK